MAERKPNKEFKLKVGRPLDYQTVEELQSAVKEYFQTETDHITITGLALFLGFNSRQSLINYEERPEYMDTVKKAKLFIENSYENGLLGGKNPIGFIFALKNFGWADRQEIKHEGIPDKEITQVEIIRVNREDSGRKES